MISLANRRRDIADAHPHPLGLETARQARAFHQGFAEYAPTPLVALPGLAARLGIGRLWIKDEAGRFGLKAFKVLGGSYAMGRALMARAGEPAGDMTLPHLLALRDRLGQLCFVTATDGNHGAGVAWTARALGHQAVVYMPRGTAAQRVRFIEGLGAQAIVTDMPYDDTARLAWQTAQAKGWLFAQDTTMPGYTQFPANCMRGYTTMALECLEALQGERPSHVIIQAGAGTLAGGIAGFCHQAWADDPPRLIVVEADSCNAIQRTAAADDGRLHKAQGDLDTIMAGLSVGEVCTVGWEVLRHSADHFAAIGNREAADGMRVLGAPLAYDQRVIAGESGAAGLGFLYAFMSDEAYAPQRQALGLDRDSKVLCFNTEGDTDQAHYLQVVWRGAHGLGV